MFLDSGNIISDETFCTQSQIMVEKVQGGHQNTPREAWTEQGHGVVVNQAYSRLSTTHGLITDCKLDSVVYVGVHVS